MADHYADVIDLSSRRHEGMALELVDWVQAPRILLEPDYFGDDFDIRVSLSDALLEHGSPVLSDAEGALDGDSESLGELPLVFCADLLPSDLLDRQRTERLIRGIGATGMASVIERRRQDREQTLLLNGKQAVAGDVLADERVMASCRTDLGERAFKSGIVSPVVLEEGEDGDIHQNGLSMVTVASNTLRFAAKHPVMRDIAEAEALNIFRIETANRLGLFDLGYMMVMESAVSDQLTPAEAEDQNFFVPTMTASIQVVRKKSGVLTNSSMMVAGVVESGAVRHDIEGLNNIADTLGLVGREELSTLDRLQNVYFIHESKVPNGEVDILMAYDAPHGTFFGEKCDAVPTVEDYQAKIEEGYELLRGLEDTALRVKKRFLQEVTVLSKPEDAIALLDQISHQELLSRSFVDETIKPMVFGAAAPHIEDARHYRVIGDKTAMQGSWGLAWALAVSSACPGKITGSDGSSVNQDEHDAGDGKGPLRFKCLNGHDCVRPFNGYLDECPKCKDGGKSVGC